MMKLTKDRSFYKTLFAVALPAAFQALIAQLVNLSDTILVGHLPGYAMAGVGQTNEISNIFFMATLGLISGASVLISQYWGRRDTARIKQIFSIVLTVTISLSVLVAVLVRIFPHQILSRFNKDMAVVEAAIPYITIFCFSFIPYAIAQALIGMLRAIEVTRITLVMSIVTLFVDVGLNILLIFGIPGVLPGMGVRGAALGTLLARWVEVLIVGTYVFKVQKVLPMRLRDLGRAERWLWRDYRKHGLPVALGDAQWALVGLGKTFIIGQLGGLMVSANIIATEMLSLGMLFCFALANGAAVVIGKTDRKSTRLNSSH